MDLDFLKTIRETIDWLVQQYNGRLDDKTKKKLEKVADQIIELSTHKVAYLIQLKADLKDSADMVNLANLRSAIRIAEEDTKKLHELLDGLSFDTSKISFSLKNGMKSLTIKKEMKVEELKKIISKEILTNEAHQYIISELESFANQWKELGNQIDDYFKKGKS